MKFEIPKSFEMGPYKIKITKCKNLAFEDGALGIAMYNTNEIRLQTKQDGYPIMEEQIMTTFFHELVHFVFHMVERRDLCENEQLVERCAKMLAQYTISKKGTCLTLDI